jgi:hypothetical protein
MKWHLIIWLWAVNLYSQQTPSLPYQPAPMTDQKGQEWLIESNGGLQRQTSAPTMIGNCLMLHVGTQQFYGQQALASPDGAELMMTNPQPQNGLKITRWITFFEREGALRYVEELQNTTHRDLTTQVEIRHSFNNAARGIYSNAGRELKADLEASESGVLCLPEEGSSQTPALFFMMRAPGAKSPLRLSFKGNYQLSASYVLTIPAGQTQSILHGVSQIKLGEKATPEEAAKACLPYSLKKLSRGLAKTQLSSVMNLKSETGLKNFEDWFPTQFWSIPATTFDQLALGDDSLLQGQAGAESVALLRESGPVSLPWARLSALAGPLLTGNSGGWLWLRDGQRWHGVLKTPGLHLDLINGSKMPIQKLDRLVLALPNKTPELSFTLMELKNGERLTIKPEGQFRAELEFGQLNVPWSEILMMQGNGEEHAGRTIFLRDGSRLQARPLKGEISLETVDLGTQKIDLSQLLQIITPESLKAQDWQAEDPAVPYLELAGDQRLIARITDTTFTLKTVADPVSLAVSSLRELTLEDEDGETTSPRFKATLWAGGHITGRLESAELSIEGPSFRGKIPVAMIQRVVNPIPITDSALMNKIGQLVRELGDEQWKVRENATNTLRGLGLVAKGSLQEALKTSTDAEVTRRLEELLQDLE